MKNELAKILESNETWKVTKIEGWTDDCILHVEFKDDNFNTLNVFNDVITCTKCSLTIKELDFIKEVSAYIKNTQENFLK